MIQHKGSGFTIIELMIATMIFSVVLLLCTTGLLQIGRMYYKGVTNSKTQETARAIVEEISQAIQFNGGSVISPIMSSGVAPDVSTGFCVGEHRYSMLLGKELIEDPSKHGLVEDQLPACSSSSLAQDLGSGTALTSGSREFLAPLMRVANLSVQSQGSNLYRVTVRVVYGDDDLLDNPNGTDAACKTTTGSQFCSVAELTTVVQKRIQ